MASANQKKFNQKAALTKLLFAAMEGLSEGDMDHGFENRDIQRCNRINAKYGILELIESVDQKTGIKIIERLLTMEHPAVSCRYKEMLLLKALVFEAKITDATQKQNFLEKIFANAKGYNHANPNCMKHAFEGEKQLLLELKKAAPRLNGGKKTKQNNSDRPGVSRIP